MKDNLGEPCRCGVGILKESAYDKWQHVVHCDVCNRQIVRFEEKGVKGKATEKAPTGKP